MRPLSDETLKKMDEELAGIGFNGEELQKIAPQMGLLIEEAMALDEIDLEDAEPSLIYSFEME